ncbi:right-handed parallel beta-helix repeat-containing protein [Paenibacillus methanolicus]|uniref:Parallel beta helix pectate lyase-like protein n=1 Tax=Paenibacillus methanolicus TaxID=582686 RepID=A0A5S5BKR6_9BACL|nr:right-handed parallel beta-helix repeat-containing protein [Paenibacillus methanolicus]TYP67677.1 parallel beta helix pectate lyase-like protein [Paenibacillus methanolicus]
MENDKTHISRREALGIIGTAGAALAGAVLMPGRIFAESVEVSEAENVLSTTSTSSQTLNLKDYPKLAGEVDDTLRLNRFFNDLKSMPGINGVIPEGTYAISQVVTVSLVNQYLFAYGAKISSTVAALKIENSQNSIIEGLSIEIKVKSDSQKYIGISIFSSKHLILQFMNVRGAGWIGITSEANTANITILNCRIEDCNYGIRTVASSTNIKIIGCYISNHWSQSSEATNQGSLPVWSSPSLFYDGITIKGENCLIEGCVIEDNGQSGIYSGGVKRLIITNNVIRNNWNKGIDLGTSDTQIEFVDITSNIVENNKTGNIHFFKVNYSSISNNIVLNSDIKYSSISNYVEPCIIFNNVCIGNRIHNNTIWNVYDEVAVFINVDPSTKSIDNSIIGNTINSKNRFNPKVELYNQLTDASLQTVSNLRVDNILSLPKTRTSPDTEGAISYNPTTKKLEFYDGTTIRTVTST